MNHGQKQRLLLTLLPLAPKIFALQKCFSAAPALVLCVLLYCLLGCSSSRFEVTELTITTVDGKQLTISAEVARTDAERQRGLMYRKKLADGKGMIFIFERDQTLSFWMKDTLIPLSIAFISADGRIVEIYDMEPRNLASVYSNRSCRYALEVPQGWFARAGVGIGDRVIHPAASAGY